MSVQFTPIKSAPRVSVIIAAFDAHETITCCLESLRAQTFRDFEVILVDSSHGEETAAIATRFPEVRFERSAVRLYPHEARNRAASHARGELLVSIDADVYPHPDWLVQLVREYDASGQVIVGALACHGPRLRDLGMHFCKFAKFLPAGAVRVIDTAPTGNLLVAREDFARVGGMRGDRYVADVALGRDLEAIGKQIRFAPRAIVDHHDTDSIAAFFRERYVRGRLYGRMRASWLPTRRSTALYLVVSILPIRLARIAWLTYRYCAAAGMTGAFLLTWPLALAGHAAWLAGESIAYAGALFRVRARRPSARNNGAALARTTRWGPQ
ncbi:MAG TPA: glycosyltransferase family 2 protein [Thermoanaerobaculia bacterium]|jgi:glycosyltransferase involved in cell wall biosynthesis|nr:glycosyltransferase family 2 protein [Thermoanaerobaculia bacterium]